MSAVSFQVIIFLMILHYLNALISLAFGFFMFSCATAKHMIQELRSINKDVKAKIDKSRILERLTRIIAMQMDAKQLNSNGNKSYSE